MGPASNKGPSALARLVHHRWALPVLARVATDGGCKFVTLSKALQVAPPSLKRTLTHLAELDLVVPNPGYGHPLRPEYILGDLGREVASPAGELWQWMRATSIERPMLKKWSLPTLAAIGLGARRFNEIQSLLLPATPRATALALKDLLAIQMAARAIDDGFPPTPSYTPAAGARDGLIHMRALGDSLAHLGFAGAGA